MQCVIYAAILCGYCVQVIDGGEIVQEYSAGNCGKESQTFIDPCSPNAVTLRQLNRWAAQTARKIAQERKIPVVRVQYDPDLEVELMEQAFLALA